MEEAIYLQRYRFTIQAVDRLTLPEYLGSTLRGGFGHVFRRLACPGRRGEACPAPHLCPYHLIFEAAPPPDAPALRNLEDIPRPFVISPPPVSERVYDPGVELSFDLTLVGRAGDFFPYFVVAFRELGQTGLGRQRGRFTLKRIDAINPISGEGQLAFSDADCMVRGAGFRVSLTDCRRWTEAGLSPASSTRLRLSFATPTRLKHAGGLVDRPEFHVVFRALLRRLSSLALFHCGVKLDVDYRALIARAEKVRLAKNGTGWVDWERYSSRQREKMFFGGLVGPAVYEGDIMFAFPYLYFGQWTHVGKNATFGLGRYQLLPGSSLSPERPERGEGQGEGQRGS